jgi:single-stranded-DNA-specific exonuclease
VSQSFIWQYFPEQQELSEKIGAYFNCDPVIGQLMLNRSVYTIQDATHFMNHTWDNWPMLPNQGDLMAGLAVLMDQQAAICVYGDYDVDGVTSTTILVTLLRQAGCRVDYIVPHRFNDGYGLAMHRMDTIATKKYDALITIAPLPCPMPRLL